MAGMERKLAALSLVKRRARERELRESALGPPKIGDVGLLSPLLAINEPPFDGLFELFCDPRYIRFVPVRMTGAYEDLHPVTDDLT